MQKETIVDFRLEFEHEFKDVVTRSSNCCIALFNLKGELLYSNKAMLVLFKANAKAKDSLVNPNFDKLVNLKSSNSLVFEGVLTVGDSIEINSSLDAKIYRKNNRILIFGEVSGVQLFEQNASMHSLNQEISNLQRNLIKEKRSLQKALSDLNEANLELKELNATKDKFFSIIAHDLRSPFNSILGFSKLLSDNVLKYTPENIELMAVNIYKSSNNAFELLENLLAWSRIQRKLLIPNLQPLDYRITINSVLELCKPTANSKNIGLELSLDIPVEINADEQMLHSTLRNLIINAIKFTHPLGTVKITTQNKENVVLFIVSDTGIGIDASNLNKLFSVLCELSTPGTSNEKGTGLGLILCKDFVEIQKGTIWVESEVGVGSLFKFTLPRINK